MVKGIIWRYVVVEEHKAEEYHNGNLKQNLYAFLGV